MTKFKRLAASVMAAASLALSSMGVMTASANNCTDTEFSFYFVGSGAHCTELRDKTDYSSSYAYLDFISNGSVVAHIYDEDGVDRTAGTPKTLIVGTGVYLPNYVKENNKSKAKLGVTKGTDSTVINCSGLWSPDSV